MKNQHHESKISVFFRGIKEVLKSEYRHYVAIGLVVVSIALISLLFPQSYIKFWASIQYMAKSIAFYVNFLYGDGSMAKPSTPSINFIGGGDTNIPMDVRELLYLFRSASIGMINRDILVYYSIQALSFFLTVLQYIIPIPLLMVLIALVKRIYLRKHPKDDGKSTDSLIRYQEYERKVQMPVINWIAEFGLFMEEHSYYLRIIIAIWLFGLDFWSMCANLIAWWLILPASINMTTIIDPIISLAFFFIPFLYYLRGTPGVIALVFILYLLRRLDGYQKIKLMDDANQEILEDMGLECSISGPPGIGKTETQTALSIYEEKRERLKALDIIHKYEIIFPNFPWLTFEEWITNLTENREIVNRAQLKKKVLEKWTAFTTSNPRDKTLLFDYDISIYPLRKYNGIKYVEMDEAMKAYSQAFFLYTMRDAETGKIKPLAIGNYSIRFDMIEKKGYRPELDYNLLKRNNRKMSFWQTFTTRIDFNLMRLYKPFAPNGGTIDPEAAFMFDGGVIHDTEFHNEVGNQKTNVGQSKLDDESNRVNDGLVEFHKIPRHIFTIDGTPFVKIFFDTQREPAIADGLMSIVESKIRLRSKEDAQSTLFGFGLQTAVFGLFHKAFTKFWDNFRRTRRIFDLPSHLIINFVSLIEAMYFYEFNLYGYKALTYAHDTGGSSVIAGEASKGEFYIIYRVMRTNRYATDCYEDYMDEAREKATTGFRDAKPFISYRGTRGEFALMNSHGIVDMNGVAKSTINQTQQSSGPNYGTEDPKKA